MDIIQKIKKKGAGKNGSANASKPMAEKKTFIWSKSEAEPSEKTITQSYIQIDFPKNKEAINPSHYSIRIAAGGDGAVQISIDNGEWQSCRFAAGYYWFDWCSIPSGKHTCTARLCLPDGSYKKSKPITCYA